MYSNIICKTQWPNKSNMNTLITCALQKDNKHFIIIFCACRSAIFLSMALQKQPLGKYIINGLAVNCPSIFQNKAIKFGIINSGFCLTNFLLLAWLRQGQIRERFCNLIVCIEKFNWHFDFGKKLLFIQPLLFLDEYS